MPQPLMVTHLTCPHGPGASATHHMVPRRGARPRNHFEHACQYCGRTAEQIRTDTTP